MFLHSHYPTYMFVFCLITGVSPFTLSHLYVCILFDYRCFSIHTIPPIWLCYVSFQVFLHSHFPTYMVVLCFIPGISPFTLSHLYGCVMFDSRYFSIHTIPLYGCIMFDYKFFFIHTIPHIGLYMFGSRYFSINTIPPI